MRFFVVGTSRRPHRSIAIDSFIINLHTDKAIRLICFNSEIVATSVPSVVSTF